MKIGFDTGFFVELFRGRKEAVEVWEKVVEGEYEAFVSCLTLYELNRLALKGKLSGSSINAVVEALVNASVVVWITDADVCRRAASLSHELGIPSVDALILSCLAGKGVQEIYTTDRHLALCRAAGVVVRLL